MSPQQIDFGILVVILLFIGNEVTQVKRKVDELDEKLEHLQIDGKRIGDGMRESLQEVRDGLNEGLQDVRRDLQEECRDVGKNLHDDLDSLRDSIRGDLKHEIEMHEIRTGD